MVNDFIHPLKIIFMTKQSKASISNISRYGMGSLKLRWLISPWRKILIRKSINSILCITFIFIKYMMTSSNGNIFRVTGHLRREFTGPRWIPRTKASDAEIWYFLWSAPEWTIEINNREASDLRRHRDHYDVTIMISTVKPWRHLSNMYAIFNRKQEVLYLRKIEKMTEWGKLA